MSVGNILTIEQVCQLARDHGGGVPPNLIVAVANWESGLDADAVSSDGYDSIGLMQLVHEFHKDVNLKDPATNIAVGAQVLASNFYLLNHIRAALSNTQPWSSYPWDNELFTKRSLGGYNAGAGNVEAWDARGLTPETWPAAVAYARGCWDEFTQRACG